MGETLLVDKEEKKEEEEKEENLEGQQKIESSYVFGSTAPSSSDMKIKTSRRK